MFLNEALFKLIINVSKITRMSCKANIGCVTRDRDADYDCSHISMAFLRLMDAAEDEQQSVSATRASVAIGKL